MCVITRAWPSALFQTKRDQLPAGRPDIRKSVLALFVVDYIQNQFTRQGLGM